MREASGTESDMLASASTVPACQAGPSPDSRGISHMPPRQLSVQLMRTSRLMTIDMGTPLRPKATT